MTIFQKQRSKQHHRTSSSKRFWNISISSFAIALFLILSVHAQNWTSPSYAPPRNNDGQPAIENQLLNYVKKSVLTLQSIVGPVSMGLSTILPSYFGDALSINASLVGTTKPASFTTPFPSIAPYGAGVFAYGTSTYGLYAYSGGNGATSYGIVGKSNDTAGYAAKFIGPVSIVRDTVTNALGTLDVSGTLSANSATCHGPCAISNATYWLNGQNTAGGTGLSSITSAATPGISLSLNDGTAMNQRIVDAQLTNALAVAGIVGSSNGNAGIYGLSRGTTVQSYNQSYVGVAGFALATSGTNSSSTVGVYGLSGGGVVQVSGSEYDPAAGVRACVKDANGTIVNAQGIEAQNSDYVSGLTQNIAFGINEYSGFAASPLDSTPDTRTGIGSLERSNAITVSSAGRMIVHLSSEQDSTGAFTYTQNHVNIYKMSDGNYLTLQSQDYITPSTGPYTMTATTGHNWTWASVAAAYKGAPTIARVANQATGSYTQWGRSLTVAFPNNVTAGNTILVFIGVHDVNGSAWNTYTVSKFSGTATIGPFTEDVVRLTTDSNLRIAIARAVVTGSGSLSINVTKPDSSAGGSGKIGAYMTGTGSAGDDSGSFLILSNGTGASEAKLKILDGAGGAYWTRCDLQGIKDRMCYQQSIAGLPATYCNNGVPFSFRCLPGCPTIPKICKNDISRTCTQTSDCGTPGLKYCVGGSQPPNTVCTTNADCPGSPKPGYCVPAECMPAISC